VELEEGAIAQSAFETFQMRLPPNLLSFGWQREEQLPICMAPLSSAENH
jgi:hypothetical protein